MCLSHFTVAGFNQYCQAGRNHTQVPSKFHPPSKVDVLPSIKECHLEDQKAQAFWNDLTPEICVASTFISFRKSLKTKLFSRGFGIGWF